MNKMTIAIVICTALTLTACGKTSDTESVNQTTSSDTMKDQNWSTVTEQQAPTDPTAETGTGSAIPTEQAAFEVEQTVNEKGEMIEGTNKE
ncbi:MAG: hypothetical protein B6D78_09985 [gamma proteobacterium symbiont of Ctena orbiculata]|nr:MAG: hypothetical protein B6D78_09985 [gamma proteobacterium symbiont of Ctena orbiculata]PVV27378.1 MAG: hypothetical protein B6D79_02735 [gamma proteobacterium symbiont of Ctena orbiculata]